MRANARRKRVERILRKEQALSDSLHKRNLNLLADLNYLLDENKKVTSLYRALAAELLGDVLAAEDRESVTKGLTRKL